MPERSATDRPRVLYLSAAPRVSTRDDAAEPGPRSHIVGTISGFRSCDWDVVPFIVGDHLPIGRGKTDGGSAKSLTRLLATDLFRLSSEALARLAVARHCHRLSLCYERAAALQTLGSSARRLSGAPWILETQALMWRDAIERRSLALRSLAQRREREAYRDCSLIVAVSEAVRRDVVDFAGVRPNKVLVVPNGVDVIRFAPPPCPRIVPTARLHLVFVGTIVRWQGLDRLVTAIAHARTAGVPIEATIIGDGAERRSLEEQIRIAGLEPWVRFTGRVPHSRVNELLSGADLGYSGQLRTSGHTMHHSPLKLYEYAASGLPFIASDFADARDVCPPSASWLLFDPDDSDGPLPAILSAWRNRSQLPAISAALRTTAVRRLSWHARVSAMLVDCKGLLGRA